MGCLDRTIVIELGVIYIDKKPFRWYMLLTAFSILKAAMSWAFATELCWFENLQ